MQPQFIMRVPKVEVPETNDPNVKALIDKIHLSQGGVLPNSKSQIIEIRPEKGAEAFDCFNAVEEKVHKNGGRRVLGWDLYYGSPLLMRANFHAIWESPTGDLLDITPKPDNRERILFVDAPSAKYEGKQVFDIILNYTKNPLADDFIICLKAIYNLENKGERAYQHGEILLTPHESQLIMGIKRTKDSLEQMVNTGKKSKNTPCFCGSNIKYKHCCGKELERLFKLSG